MAIETFDGETNMRLDTEMFSRVGTFAFRIYEWSEVCITIGRNQRRADATDDPTVPVIQRPTGGAAVLHGHDLTVSLAADLRSLGCDERDLRAIYGMLVNPIILALGSCGIEADYGGSTPNRPASSTYCFASSSAYDIINLITGKKLCGCAMRVSRERALIQVSIPTRIPTEEATQLIKNYVALPPCRIDAQVFSTYFREIIPKSMC